MHSRKVGVIGLGYVGLPVAVEFGKSAETIGFDINDRRIQELKEGRDATGEVSREELQKSKIRFTSRAEDLKAADFLIVAVPTPIDEFKRPDLTPLYRAAEALGPVVKKGDIIVIESTVFPGATEEEFGPKLEACSGLKAGVDFKLGYSPERINPGDKLHRFSTIKKVVSAQDSATLEIVSEVYGSVVQAGLHRAPTIRVAEAAKVIENTQRDLNIALINELAIIFDRMDIDTRDVLEAAGTKWNFLKFEPGLVGGHCIGVDPYYLTHQVQKYNYHPEVILAGRRINDSMGAFIANKTVNRMLRMGMHPAQTTVTVFGVTFKEDVPDCRNSKVVDVIEGLKSYGLKVQVHDPVADSREFDEHYHIPLTPLAELKPADVAVFCVSHESYLGWDTATIGKYVRAGGLFIDVKGKVDRQKLRPLNLAYWRL